MARQKIDDRLRAEFKEWARRIIGDDRLARKYGLSQNTIGEIERALVQAFTMGQSGNYTKQPLPPNSGESEIVPWIMIPPRARSTLDWIAFLLFRMNLHFSNQDTILERINLNGRDRWIVPTDRNKREFQTFSSGGVIPLKRMGLLAESRNNDDGLVLTPKGVATCKEYWRRYSANDPTLPKISLRP
ncbi:MAG: hypothetical protein KDA49_15950 [Rhodospirillaceae bacterium]|nr:hypothetical protein [Rhodospirillaceae bacterium]MCA8933969.1 hypothetical protein [Rhodospirillaceae bacterium]